MAKKPATAKKPAPIGHNGKINKALVDIFDKDDKRADDSKAIARARRDLRAKAKEEQTETAAA